MISSDHGSADVASNFMDGWRKASKIDRKQAIRFILMPYPNWFGNVRMYGTIITQLFLIYGIVGVAMFRGFPYLQSVYGTSWLVNFFLYATMGSALLSLTAQYLSKTVLTGIQVRQRYEIERMSKVMKQAVTEMMSRIESGELSPADLEQELSKHGTVRDVRVRRVNPNDNPVRNALEHLEAQDRAMNEQEQNIRDVHEGDVDLIKNLLKQLEENDRKARENRPDNEDDEHESRS